MGPWAYSYGVQTALVYKCDYWICARKLIKGYFLEFLRVKEVYKIIVANIFQIDIA